MSHPEFYNPASLASECDLGHSTVTEGSRSGGAETSSGLQIDPPDARNSLRSVVQALTMYHSYRVTKPKTPYGYIRDDS
jgi:hypothetical protein